MSCIRDNWTNVDGVKNGSITCYHNDGTLHFNTYTDNVMAGGKTTVATVV